MGKKIFTQTFILLFFISLSSFGQKAVFRNVNIGLSVSGVSADGKYLVGSSQNDQGTTSFIYNTDTEEVQQFVTGEDFRGNSFEAVSNNGIIVGKIGEDFGTCYPAYFKDGKWFELPQPDSNIKAGYKGYGSCYGITVDGNIISGHVNLPAQYVSCIWENIDGEYKITVLEMPKEDIFGSEPKYMMQGASIARISTDGKVIIARFTGYGGDKGGKYVLPIVWTKTENNKYEYRILGEEINYNLDKQIPKYELDVSDEEWNVLYREFMKNTFVSSYNLSLSDNGRYLATGINETNYTTFQQTNAVLVFDLENDSYTIFDDPTSNEYICGIAAMNDGTIFGATPYKTGSLPNAYVFNMVKEEEAGISMEDWISNKYEVNVNTDEMINTGVAFASGNGNIVGCNYTNVSGGSSFYYVKKQVTSGIKSIDNSKPSFTLYAENSTIYINAQENQIINIYSIDGRLLKQITLAEGENTITGLSKGIYLINNQKVVVK